MLSHGDRLATVARTRLSPPRIRHECVARPRLIERLVHPEATTVLITAPAGSGKSTVMAQAHVASRDGVWLSIHEADNDPARLWTAIGESLASAVPGFDPVLVGRLRAPQAPSIDSVVAAVVNELATSGVPVRLFVDDVHLLTDPVCLRSLESFLQLRPPSAALVLAGRVAPPIHLKRHDLAGHLVEVGAGELMMTTDEAGEMLDAVGVRLAAGELDRLHARVEGWVAGLRWAAMALEDGQDVEEFVRSAASLRSDIGRYLVEELLDRSSDEKRRFMLETSILGHMCADLCNAVRERQDSGHILEELERSNAIVVSTDRGDGWCRYHHLGREVIAARLADEAPDAMQGLHRRAAEWLFAHHEVLDAVDHAFAAGDRTDAADMLCASWWPLLNQGQLETIVQILERFDASEIRAYQPLAIAAAATYGIAGDVDRATTFHEFALEGDFDGAPPDGSASIRSSLAIMRAAMMFDGVEQALRDAELAHGLEPVDSPWRPFTAFLRGVGLTWSGDPDRAVPFYEEVTAAGTSDEAIVVYALAEIALAKLGQGDPEAAKSTALRACERAATAGLDTLLVTATAHGAGALSHLALDDPDTAAAHLEAASTAMQDAGLSLPMDSMRTQLLLADAAMQLGCIDVAASYLDDAELIQRKVEDTGVLGAQLGPARARLDHARAEIEGHIDLTDREQEVLALLATKLTSREIGAELYLSRNTIRTYQRRLYEKLGVNSREDAVVAARRARLLPDKEFQP